MYSGVPQSPHCGASFDLFLNAIKSSIVNAVFLLLTNDWKLYKNIENARNIEFLQRDTDNSYEWWFEHTSGA